jgi:hypothetical protein
MQVFFKNNTSPGMHRWTGLSGLVAESYSAVNVHGRAAIQPFVLAQASIDQFQPFVKSQILTVSPK